MSPSKFVNSLGMKMVRIPPGKYLMGYSRVSLPKTLTLDLPYRSKGDYDERPYHYVTIERSFYASEHEVTNSVFEQIDPSHARYRGAMNFSRDDDEAVIFVSWHDAVSFCDELAKRENRKYRLPTEAEWEYAARANTVTYFNTGDDVPKSYQKCQKNSWYPGEPEECPLPKLTVGQTPANGFGLKDTVGNVEEWTADWYGWYDDNNVTNPVGPSDGDFKVSRGGSHSTELYYLRSANRMGTLPEDMSWYIGFRVVMEDPNPEFYTESDSHLIPIPKQRDEPSKENFKKSESPLPPPPNMDPNEPYFYGPLKYVNIPHDHDHLPFGHHNHDPAICPCPNGDIFAIWYSCWSETDRELGIVSSRLPNGSSAWETPSIFWNAPDRNDHAPAMYVDENQTMYHFNGLSAAGTFGSLATIMRTSNDSGRTWSRADLIFASHGLKHMPVETVIKTKDGALLLPTDGVTGGTGYTVLHVSLDNGYTWADPPLGPILGIHGAVVQLTNGSLYALGRGDDIDGNMVRSLSTDMGRKWSYARSPFPGIHGGQREVLLRLNEGPIMMLGFANEPMPIIDVSNGTRHVTGLYAAISYDEGETWPNRRLLSDDGKGRKEECLDGKTFVMSYKTAEPNGYMSARQSKDGLIHIISSRNYYRINAKWLSTRPPVPPRNDIQ